MGGQRTFEEIAAEYYHLRKNHQDFDSIDFHRDIIEKAIESSVSLDDLVACSDKKFVPGKNLAFFFENHLLLSELLSKLNAIGNDSMISSLESGTTLQDYLKNNFSMDIDTKIPFAWVEPRLVTAYIKLAEEEGHEKLKKSRLGLSTEHHIQRICVYHNNPKLIDELIKELESKRMNTCGGNYSYREVLILTALIERQRILYDDYSRFFQKYVNPKDDETYQEHLGTLEQFMDLLEEGPSFSDVIILPEDPVSKKETRELLKNYYDLREKVKKKIEKGKLAIGSLQDLEDPDVKKISKIISILIDQTVDERKRTKDIFDLGVLLSVYDRKDVPDGLTKKQKTYMLLNRLYRMLDKNEIVLVDHGPLPQVRYICNQVGFEIQTKNGTSEEKLDVIKEFDRLYLGYLRDRCCNADFRVTNEAIYDFSRKFIPEDESARILFGLKRKPVLGGKSPGQLCDLIAERSKKYSGKTVNIFRPFSLGIFNQKTGEDEQRAGYVLSDISLDATTHIETVTSQLVESGTYSPIKLELLIRDIVSSGEFSEENFYTFDQIMQQLGCHRHVAQKILRENKVQEQNIVLLEAHTLLLKDPLIKGFDTYDSVHSFYKMHLSGDESLRAIIEPLQRYHKQDVEALKREAFITPVEAGSLLGFNFPLDAKLAAQSTAHLGRSKQVSLNQFTIDGDTLYYKPEILSLASQNPKKDNDFYRFALYHSLMREFSR